MCKFWRSEMCKSSHCNLNITIFIISTWVDLGESRSWPPPPSKDPLWKFEVLKIYLAKLPNISNLLPLHKHSDIPQTFPRKIFRDPRMHHIYSSYFVFVFFFNCHVVWLNESSFWQTSVYIRRHSSFYREDQLHDQFIFLFLTNVTTCISSSLYIFIKQ